MPQTQRTLFARFLTLLRKECEEFPNWYYTGPVIVWVLFVSWASLTPPEYLPQFTFRSADKFEHGGSYAILAILLLRAWVREGRPQSRAVLKVWTICFLWGAYLELMQRLTPLRTMDWRDAVANGVGAALGLLGWVIALAFLSRRAATPEAS